MQRRSSKHVFRSRQLALDDPDRVTARSNDLCSAPDIGGHVESAGDNTNRFLEASPIPEARLLHDLLQNSLVLRGKSKKHAETDRGSQVSIKYLLAGRQSSLRHQRPCLAPD